MKVLFVYLDIDVKGGARSYNYGIGIISAVLRDHGHETDLFYMYPKYETHLLKDRIRSFQPEVIAFAATSPQFKYVEQIFSDVHFDDEVFTICGGHHVTCVPESLERIPRLNAICIGEGEYPLLELVEALEDGGDITGIRNLWVKSNGEIYRNPCRPFIQDIDRLPFADRDIFDYQAVIDSDYDTALFMFARGCPFDCSYCANHVFKRSAEGHYVRLRSVDNAIREIKQVTQRYRVKAIFVCNEVFGINKKWAFEFCKKYEESGIGLPFDVNTRVETITSELCEALKTAGCRRISIGIESGNPLIRNQVLKRKMSNEQIIRAFQLAKKAGLRTKSFNIVGFPNETRELFQDTVELNRTIEPDTLTVAIFDPYPGTSLYDDCQKEDLFRKDDKRKGFVARTDTVLDLPDFPRKEILRCYRNFAYDVYKKQDMRKAILYRIYYSEYGEVLIRVLAPLKKAVRRLAMGI